MKNIYSCFICFLFMILVSCSEEDLLIDGDFMSNNENVIHSSTVINDVDLDYCVNEEGILVFATLQDYQLLTASLIKMDEEEFKDWEKKVNFKSLRTYINQLYQEGSEYIKNRGDYEIWVKKYSKYLILDEDGFVEPIIGSQLYRSIVNRNGEFYIGTALNKVDKEYVTITAIENGMDNSRKMKYVFNNVHSRGEYGNVVEYPKITGYGYTGANVSHSITTWFKIYNNSGTDFHGNTVYSLSLDVMSEASSILIWPFWSRNNDYFTIEGFKIHLPGLGFNTFFDENSNLASRKDEMWFLSPTKSKKCSRYTLTYLLTNSFNGSVEIPQFIQDPVCVHYKASSSGAHVSYNTFHPLPGMDECGHDVIK